MHAPTILGLIAGNGVYPRLLVQNARRAGVSRIVTAAFTGETDAALAQEVDAIDWLRVGQLGRLIKFFREQGVQEAIMAGQVAPRNLFDFRPDWKALLLLARLKTRNAETIFSAIADELYKNGIELLAATSFLEDYLATPGRICGPSLSKREEQNVAYGTKMAREVARLDIGQTVVVRNGTVLAVEAFDGTNETIRRGAGLARKDAIVVKVTKPGQDMRFDVPCIGPETIRIAAEAGVRVIAVEAGRTLLLDKEELIKQAEAARISIVGVAL